MMLLAISFTSRDFFCWCFCHAYLNLERTRKGKTKGIPMTDPRDEKIKQLEKRLLEMKVWNWVVFGTAVIVLIVSLGLTWRGFRYLDAIVVRQQEIIGLQDAPKK